MRENLRGYEGWLKLKKYGNWVDWKGYRGQLVGECR